MYGKVSNRKRSSGLRLGLLVFSRFICVINKDAVADTGGFARGCHLKGDEFAIVADDRVRCFVTRIITEMGQALVRTATVELQFPEVDKTWTFEVLLVAFDERELAIRIDALRFIILSGRI